jgi:hypothetical protein
MRYSAGFVCLLSRSFASLPRLRRRTAPAGRSWGYGSLLAATLFILGLAPARLLAQANATGTITGQVVDPSGAVIAGAQVTVTDTATKSYRSQPTNSAGNFVFTNVEPGVYDIKVTKSGFRQWLLTNQTVTLGGSLTLNVTLEVGAPTQTVEVTGTPGAELQTLNSTMGTTVNNATLLPLPSLNRDVSSLLNLQPTAAPTFHVEGDITSGSVAGATPEQNTFMLDGGTNTSGLEGDNGYINGFSGNQRGIVPTPIESIEEVTVNTNNMTADFNTSAGAEILAVTKRGTDTWHGSAYDYFQGDWLNANNWDNNFHHTPKPKSHQNRFGFSAGGPMLPPMLGGKTYFYYDYEGERFPRTGPFTRLVPSDLLRQGIIQIRTSQGVQQFNINNAAVCGPTGNSPCDPRGLGMSSVVTQMWNKYMPEPNDFTSGDRLNTFGFRGNLYFPIKNNFMVGRLDHDFSPKWRFMSTYRWYKDYSPTTNEVDIGGLLPGDTKGQPAVASRNITQPRLFVAGLTGTLTPTLTNEFHFTYTRNQWAWLRNGVVPQLPGVPGTIEIAGESTNALIPINVDTQNARRRAWYEHNWDYRDELNWLKGTHFFQFGGDMLHEWWHFNRYDNVVGGLTFLVYEIDNGSLHMDPTWQPRPCGGGVTTGCIDAGNGNELGTWNGYYADLLGIVNHTSVVATRTGADLHLNPLGTPAASYVIVNTPDLYFTDTWHIKPNVTLSYGLNWGVQMPPHDINGMQMDLVDPANNPVTYTSYVSNRVKAAQNGQVYNPTLGFSPVGAIAGGLKYPFNPYYGQFAPRVSLAWSPNSDNWIFGHKATVFRGGFGRFYARDFGINVVSNPVLGDGFLQPVSCTGPSMTGACLGQDKVDPTDAFRLGSNADGLVAPLPALAPTLQSPVQPGVTAPYAVLTDSMDRDFRPASYDRLDFSIQRQLKGNTIVELGYLGTWARHLFQGIDLNAVPWMMKLGGQTFAQAYANLWTQLHAGVAPSAVSAQPWFEAALGGAGSAYCGTASSCTAAVAANEGPNITTENVTTLWSDLDTAFTFGPALISTNQAFWTYADTALGLANYQAFIVQVTKRTSNGLTMNANFTYGHALGTIGLAQTYTLDTPDNVYDLHANWTPQPWDRKFTFNWLGTYELPFGEGHRWGNSNGIVRRLAGGWEVSPVFSFGSGLPLEVFTGGAEMGAGFAENGASAVPVGLNTASLSNSAHFNITVPESSSANPNSVAVNGNGDNGGAGVNMFGNNVINVYNHFRPFVLGIDGRPNGDGQLRGPARWNLDLGITKETKITERVALQIFGQAFNVFNHMQWSAPFLDLQDAPDFGVQGGQYDPIGNYTRVIQLGMRIYF